VRKFHLQRTFPEAGQLGNTLLKDTVELSNRHMTASLLVEQLQCSLRPGGETPAAVDTVDLRKFELGHMIASTD